MIIYLYHYVEGDKMDDSIVCAKVIDTEHVPPILQGSHTNVNMSYRHWHQKWWIFLKKEDGTFDHDRGCN